jgi:uncharacterized membrane protein
MNLLYFVIGFICGIAALILYAYGLGRACDRVKIETKAEIRAKYRACHKAYMSGYANGYKQTR